MQPAVSDRSPNNVPESSCELVQNLAHLFPRGRGCGRGVRRGLPLGSYEPQVENHEGQDTSGRQEGQNDGVGREELEGAVCVHAGLGVFHWVQPGFDSMEKRGYLIKCSTFQV